MSVLTTLGNLPAPVNAVLRHVYTGIGVATMVLVAVGLKQGDATGLGNAIHQIGDGIASIAAGISAIVAIVSPLYAAWTATRAKRIAAVGNTPNTLAITLTPTGNAVDDARQTAAAAAKMATLPEVKSVISTPEVAAATVSPKVVSP